MDRKKTAAALALLFLLNLALITVSQRAEAASYRKGSSGSVVTQIQKKLAAEGYYKASIDGIYGSRTAAAVRSYQRDRGLKVDGICGPETLGALGISVKAADSTENNVNLLARLISAEARGEPYVGQVAVGAVVLNRVEHPSFPNTISGVIYQSGAFTCVTDGQFQQPVAESAYRAARDALNGWDPTGGCLYYYNPRKTSDRWIRTRVVKTVIGNHSFAV